MTSDPDMPMHEYVLSSDVAPMTCNAAFSSGYHLVRAHGVSSREAARGHATSIDGEM